MAGDIILASGMRTPFGDFGRSLKSVPLTELGTHAAKACLAKADLSAGDVDHLVFGNAMPVDHNGYFSSRVIALNAGMPVESSALTVSRACGSGTQAIISAAQQIISGHSRIALAGGGENFSRGTYILTDARWGYKRGGQTVIEQLDWAYRDPFSHELMGETAENLSDDFGYQRDDMDEWAIMSQQRAGAAIKSGFLARQIAAIEVKEGKATRVMEIDEFPRPDITKADLAKLKPVFRSDGRITPGNSSGVTDGAAFVVVADRDSAESRCLAYKDESLWRRHLDWPPTRGNRCTYDARGHAAPCRIRSEARHHQHVSWRRSWHGDAD